MSFGGSSITFSDWWFLEELSAPELKLSTVSHSPVTPKIANIHCCIKAISSPALHVKWMLSDLGFFFFRVWNKNPIRLVSLSVSLSPSSFYKNEEDDAPIKRCPKCKVYIERDEGCAQMMCKNCKHAFCWYCLESLDVSWFFLISLFLDVDCNIEQDALYLFFLHCTAFAQYDNRGCRHHLSPCDSKLSLSGNCSLTLVLIRKGWDVFIFSRNWAWKGWLMAVVPFM